MTENMRDGIERKKKAMASDLVKLHADMVELHVPMKPSVRYKTDENTGAITLIFETARADDCPQELAPEVQDWCNKFHVNGDVLLDAMLNAAHGEMVLAVIRANMD